MDNINILQFNNFYCDIMKYMKLISFLESMKCLSLNWRDGVGGVKSEIIKIIPWCALIVLSQLVIPNIPTVSWNCWVLCPNQNNRQVKNYLYTSYRMANDLHDVDD